MNREAERIAMVERQIRRRGVRDPRLLAAMAKVPRHCFVPEPYRAHAYEDHPLPIGRNQTISQPYIVAVMTEALALTGEERILEVGTGSGYQTAILAELGKEVFTVERLAELSEQARKILHSLGYTTIHFAVGDGSRGWPEFAPYDAIVVTAGAPEIPDPLYEQLAEGGRLVIPVGDHAHQELFQIVKTPEGPDVRNLGPCRFVDLLGTHAWQEEEGPQRDT